MTNYEWTFRKDALGIRFLTWFYALDREKLNFCKLFWATVFVVPFLLPRLLAIAIARMYDYGEDRIAAHEKDPDADARLKAKRHAKAEKRMAKGGLVFERSVDKVSVFFDRIAAFFQRHIGLTKSLKVGAIGLGWTVAFGAVFAAVWAFVWACLTHGTGVALVFIWMGYVIGGCFVVVLLITGIVIWCENHVPVMERGLDHVADFFIHIGHGFRFVFRFTVTADRAIKSRSCPRIVLK